MYENKFVACVKTNGKILREVSNEIIIPYGYEYSILLKNLNTVRAQARIFIDGKSITEDSSWFVINPNSKVEIERYIRNNNLNSGNKFKFIERTSEIEDYRGIKEDDGLIRIEYKFEKISNLDNYNYIVYTNNCNFTPSVNILRNIDINETSMSINPNNGITVSGSVSNQQFTNISDFSCEQSQVIILKLLGKVQKDIISTPVTVNYKPKCTICGRKNSNLNKFCSNCGTAVTLI